MRQTRHGQLQEELLRRLEAAFRQEGWWVEEQRTHSDGGVDLLVEQGPLRYAVEARVVTREARRQELFAMLADAFLRANAGARILGARPLAVVGAPAISEAMARELSQYADRFLENSAWGTLDATGRFDLHGPGLGMLRAEPVEWRPRPVRSEPFSDLNQWMLKVLLSERLPPSVLAAPRERVRSANQLAQLARVSVPSASRFVAHFKAEGFLEEARGLQLVRVEELLHWWRRSIRRPAELPARWLLPMGESLWQLSRALERHLQTDAPSSSERHALPAELRGRRACLGLFAACEWLGYGFVHGAPLHLYLEDCSPRVLETLGLAEAQPGEPVEVWVREPRHQESVFRGAVVSRGVAASDALQCWLDVSEHPARGAEQAEQLYHRLLRPHLLEEGASR